MTSFTKDPQAIFCFGLGYTGHFVLDYLHSQGWKVAGTVRDGKKHAYFSEKGWQVYLTGKEQPLYSIEKILSDYPYIIWTIPPGSDGHQMFLSHYRPALLKVKHLKWIGYLSATSVYGDHQGGWVNEETPVMPSTARGRSRALAEKDWLNLYEKYHLPMHIFRISAIYGPGRNALESIMVGQARLIRTPATKPPQIFNRIHIEDIVQTLIASMEKPKLGSIYNLADDLPTPPEDVLNYAKDLLKVKGLPVISIDDPNVSPMTRSFYQESKKVANHLIKHELKVRLRYPSYREGLTDLWHKLRTPSTQIVK